MKNLPTFCALALLLSACMSNDYDREGAQRVKQEWQTKLQTLPVGANEAELTRWLHQNGLLKNGEKPDFSDKSYSTSNLPNGHFPVKQHWYNINYCDVWFVHLNIKLDGQNRVAKKEVRLLGSCL